MMNETRLAEIEERAAKATPGPWYTVDGIWRAATAPTWVIAGHNDPHLGKGVCDALEIMEWEEGEEPCYTQSDSDMEFIAASRTDVPDLCAEVRRLQDKLELMEATLSIRCADGCNTGVIGCPKCDVPLHIEWEIDSRLEGERK
jgi:hypothetical protein